MGESANLAFYAIVFAKGTVPKAKLDDALGQALVNGTPLETALVQLGALGRGECDELLKVRDKLGRVCRACDGITYLLQDQTEGGTKCEYCGGELLTREQQRARDAARAAPKPAPAPQRPPAPQKPAPRPAQPVAQPSGQARRPEPTPAGGIPRPAGAPAPAADALRAFEARLTQLDRQLGALSRDVTDERQARAQMGLLMNELTARLATLPAQLEVVRATAERAAADASERAISAIGERLGVDDVTRLPGRIAEQVAPRVLEAVRDRLGLDELADLPARVVAQAVAAVDARLEAARGADGADRPAVDEAALFQRVLAGVVAQVGSAPAPAPVDQDALATRAVERVLAALAQRRPADDEDLLRRAADAARALLPATNTRDDAALVEQVLEAVTARLPANDPEALAERITRRALDAVSERLERQESPVPAEGVVKAVEQALSERLGEQVAAAEQRVAQATGEVLEALNTRLDELAEAAPAAAREAARAEVAKLDDPRELLARAIAQATKSVDERLAGLRKELQAAVETQAKASAAAAPRPGADAAALQALEANVAALTTALSERAAAERELRDGLEMLESRLAASRDRSGSRSPKDEETLVLRVARTVSEAIDTRLTALEARPAAGVGDGRGGSGIDEGVIVKKATQAVWDQLESLDLPGLPARVIEQSLKSVDQKLEERLGSLVETIASEATAPVLKSIELRLEKLDLKGLPARVTREVSEKVREALGNDDDPLADVMAERVAHRMGVPPPSPLAKSAASAAAAAEVEKLADKAAARALEWVEDRLTALERGGGIEMEMARATARAVATEVLEQKLKELPVASPSSSGVFDGDKTFMADPNKSGVRAGGDAVADKRLVALAREVKSLKEAFEEMQETVTAPTTSTAERQAAAAGVGGGTGGSTDLVTLLASPEFKQAFDAKVKEVLNYIKGDLVPSAVKRAMQQASEAAS